MGGASQVSVFTIPSEPKTGERVAFVARTNDPARTVRIELWVEKRKVKACNDSVCLYQGGPFPAGRVTYAANAFDKGGNRTTSGWQQVTIRAVDTQAPALQVQHRPSRPATNQRVTILAQARDPGGVAKIEIKVDGRVVKTCTAEKCSVTGGPFPRGTVTYEVTAYDRAGNKAWSGRRSFVVTAPQPSGTSTISGRITGQRSSCRKVAASSYDRPGQPHTASVDANGNYRIANLPDGRYRVYPLADGKFELIVEPSHRDVTCKGSGTHTASFDIRGVFDG
jgi:hypothetical protein